MSKQVQPTPGEPYLTLGGIADGEVIEGICGFWADLHIKIMYSGPCWFYYWDGNDWVLLYHSTFFNTQPRYYWKTNTMPDGQYKLKCVYEDTVHGSFECETGFFTIKNVFQKAPTLVEFVYPLGGETLSGDIIVEVKTDYTKKYAGSYSLFFWLTDTWQEFCTFELIDDQEFQKTFRTTKIPNCVTKFKVRWVSAETSPFEAITGDVTINNP